MSKISVDTDKVFRISLPGKDVNSTDPLDFAVHSGFDYPKIEEDLVGTYEYTVPATLTTGTKGVLTVTHNLGYIPCAVCFMEDLDNITPTEFATLPFYEGFSGNYFQAYSTSTQFKIEFYVDFTASDWRGKDFKFKYQIWVND